MNTITNIPRAVLLCLMSLVASAAIAVNKVYIEPFSIIPGGETTVNVIMENEDKISSLQFDLQLPNGLTYVTGSEECNTARISRTSHTLNVTKKEADGSVKWRFTIFDKAVDAAKTAIVGNEGAILSFKVTADATFNGGEINLSSIFGADATKWPVEEKAMLDSKATVLANGGTYTLAPEQVSLTLAKNDTVNFYLNNTIKVVGLEAKLNLPEGVEVVTENGELLYGERLSGNASATYLASTGKILVSSMTNDEFENIDAPVFSIILKGVKPVVGTLSLSNVLISDGVTTFSVDGTPSVDVTVIDINSIVYNDLSAKLDSLNTMLNDTLDAIRNYTTEAGKAWAESDDANALVNEITEEGLYLKAEYQAGTLTEEYPLVEKIDTFGIRIAELAQKAAEAEAKALVNASVYGDLKAKLDSVSTMLNDTLEVIRNYTTEAGKAWATSEVADSLVKELAEEALKLDSVYQAGTLTEEYALVEKIDEYGTRIAELAQKAADAEAKALIKIGDVNGDGEVTIADANMIVNYYLGNNPEGFVIEAADVNEDGEVTIADANAIANIYLGEK